MSSQPVDLVYVRGPTSHVELPWEEPRTARGLRRRASFTRLVLFDRRGTGLSDPLERPPTLEEQMEDLRAVMDAVGLERTALLGGLDVGLCALFAATFPDEVTSLVLSSATAAGPRGWPPEAREAVLDAIEGGWGRGRSLALIAPSRMGDPAFEEWWARYERAATSPGMARRLLDLRARSDFRAILPSVRVPTLVLNRAGDALAPPAAGREIAALVPDARFVELPGRDPWPFTDDVDPWIEEIEEFLTGERHAGSSDRVADPQRARPLERDRGQHHRGWVPGQLRRPGARGPLRRGHRRRRGTARHRASCRRAHRRVRAPG